LIGTKHLPEMEIAMKFNRRFVTAFLSLSVLGGGSWIVQAQEKSDPAAVKDETKMDPKGVPGSADTQSGKMPSDSSGASSSGASASDTSSGGQSATPKTPEEVTQSRDETKMDPKGVPGSPTTQSGEKPPMKP
jgi:hypothetical protein